jgi:predicted phosphate transport protein (TIGR00153 family)
MSKKSGNLYFDNFKESMAISCEAAETLKRLLTDFDVEGLPAALKVMHEIEHRGDAKKHEMTEELVRAFITPIERDDIVTLSQNIDNVTDNIEDILIHIYITNITEIRQEALDYAELLIRCCRASYFLLEEFVNFKKSRQLRDLIVQINQLEEEGDAMYMRFRRSLHEYCTDPAQIMAWDEIFSYFENVCDACEDVADIVESITIGNI